MDAIKVRGGKPLQGKIHISGAKNSALPLMCTSILTSDSLVLSNIPNLVDVTTMANLLGSLGVSISMDGSSISRSTTGRTILLNGNKIDNYKAEYDIVRKMRASILVLGPLLARFGRAEVSLPGGCAIGTRPVDFHLNALQDMGAEIEIKDGYIIASIKGKLKGAKIYFDKISVGATENILMAATLAEGTTILYNSAREPEITDLANCLVTMGARIKGIGTSTLTIEGVRKLHGAQYNVIPDRIEAGTYAVAAAITGGEIEICNMENRLMSNFTDKLIHADIAIIPTDNGIIFKRDKDFIKSVDVTTQAFPGFSTDLQAQFMALMTIAKGVSVISETIFENRFMHVPELCRMGADITINGNAAMIKGVNKLKPAQVMATDLRASVSLVLAGLAAGGETTINRVYHIDRGYENIEQKLIACGADMEMVKI